MIVKLDKFISLRYLLYLGCYTPDRFLENLTMVELIDFHFHVGVDQYYERAGNPKRSSAGDFLKFSTEFNLIKKAVIFPFPFSRYHYGLEKIPYESENRQILETPKERFYRFICFDSNYDDSLTYLTDLLENFDVDGFKYESWSTNRSIKDSKNKSLLDLMSQTKKPFLIHTDKTVNGDPLEALRVAENYADNIFILAHMARLKKEAFPIIRNDDNVFLDISPITRLFKKQEKYLFDCPSFCSIYEIVDYLIQNVGLNKIIWGSDYPFSVYSEEMQFLLGLKPAILQSFSQNAGKILPKQLKDNLFK